MLVWCTLCKLASVKTTPALGIYPPSPPFATPFIHLVDTVYADGSRPRRVSYLRDRRLARLVCDLPWLLRLRVV